MWRLILISVLSMSCTKHQFVEPPEAIQENEEPTNKRIDSQRAGLLKLGEPIPKSAFEGALQGWDYSTYWDQGYFVDRDLRMVYVDVADAVLLMSPKHTLYQVLLGPSYQTETGVRVGDTLQNLKSAYEEVSVEAYALSQGLIYRPDRVTWDPSRLNGPWTEDQDGWKTLHCAASTPALPGVRFLFERCEALEATSRVEAILITSQSDAELLPVDPILDLQTRRPCPEARTDDVDALVTQAEFEINRAKMGDYYATSSLRVGLPMLRDAALSGAHEAGARYATILFSYIGIDVIGDPLDRPMSQGAQESLFFWILAALKTEESEEDEGCFTALLDFETPLTEDLFEDDGEHDVGECAWLLTYPWLGGVEGVEAIRQQAHAWSSCWDQ